MAHAKKLSPGQQAVMAKYGAEQLARTVGFIMWMKASPDPPAGSDFAISAWAYERNSTNSMTMYAMDAEAVLDEVLAEHARTLDIMKHYDGEGAAEMHAAFAATYATVGEPRFREVVAGTLAAFMAWLKENPSQC